MHGALLVAHKHVLQPIVLEQLVIDRQHRAAGIAEDVLDALVGESLKHDLGACHRGRHVTTHWQNRA
ncbi:hypothetical protein AUC71_14500 [Methyloceanibacter marginalis]|uniref:Uncharacterized protein n=1 Tax=Methyloceanibacter marginalis TaxID=1774971 RepID=A0A1E3WA19_9HYPH|nr:hypothetical protein AUC71_14500 [Methyloceanibacter marginalis]